MDTGDYPKETAQTRRDSVLRLLKDGAWHKTMELNAPDIGGSEGTRRLRELRALGHAIEKRKAKDPEDGTQWEYRLTAVAPKPRRKWISDVDEGAEA